MIIIQDIDEGKSWSFVPTKEGYYSAYAKIIEIQQKCHRVGGDVGRVMSFVT